MSTAAVTPEVDVPAMLARMGAVPRRITSDSRDVHEGDAFAAYPGIARDGRAFIPDAIARGAGAVFWDSEDFRWREEWRLPQQAVRELRRKLGLIASHIYGKPSESLWMIGVTGTNGKTSCAHWIAHALETCGHRAAIVGTLGNGPVGKLVRSRYTTPDAAQLQELLARYRTLGLHTVAMEVSSHGLDQGRVNGVAFDVALFTNLSRDHLDYHKTMAAYGAAKARLFAWPRLHAEVINADDPFGRRLLEDARARGRKALSYGISGADITPTSIVSTSTGLALTVSTPWGSGEVHTRLTGTFNATNLLGVLGVLLVSDVHLTAALDALSRLEAPAGRMQRLGGAGKPVVVVDYAHTPDALEKTLTALRPSVASLGELVCVFGCGGDRDPGKRAEMGRIAGTLADRVVVTSDNPRGEDPAGIADAIVRGLRESSHRTWTVELDRGLAIRAAIGAARWGDVVLLAGKGHENFQEARGELTPFSDAEIATSALDEWSGA